LSERAVVLLEERIRKELARHLSHERRDSARGRHDLEFDLELLRAQVRKLIETGLATVKLPWDAQSTIYIVAHHGLTRSAK